MPLRGEEAWQTPLPHGDRTHAGVMLDKETFYVSSVDQLVFTHCDRPALIM
jgi:hypothetical protein